MTKDLEDTLNELGPEYRTLVARLRTPFSGSPEAVRPRPGRVVPYLLAASVVLVLGLAIWSSSSTAPRSSASSAPAVYTVAYAADEFALQAILDSQRNDGSWSNDYLTMQNAAALRKAHDELSRIAYKRAVRYLRAKGLSPISDDEFRSRSSRAFPAG